MRLIAIDATSLPLRPAGAGTYIINLVRALAAVDSEHSYVVYVRSHSRPSFSELPGNFEVVDIGPGARWRRQLWEQTELPRDLKRRRVALLLSPHHTTPLLFSPCPRVLTIHDVTFFVIPGRYPRLRRHYFQLMTFLGARRAGARIVPSRSVRAEASRHLRLPESSFEVIPEGVDGSFRPLPREDCRRLARERYGLPEGYLLSLGTREPGKNREAIFAALRTLVDEGRDVHLAVVGQEAWGAMEENAAVTTQALSGRVHFTGYVPQDDLPALYNAASVFLFPSLHEGFGLPVLEAMACGTPVVTSKTSALPEVAGNAALLVDPGDPKALAAAAVSVLDDASIAQSMSTAGRERAAAFTWEECARRTLAVFRVVLGEPGP